MNLYYLPLLLIVSLVTGALMTLLLWVILFVWQLLIRSLKWIYKSLTLPKPVYYKDRRTTIKATFVPKF